MRTILLPIAAVFLVLTSCMQPGNHSTPDSAEDVQPMNIGDKIPNLTLTDHFNYDVNLRELAKEKPTIFMFYRGGWCPFCNAHLYELIDIEDQLYDMGVNLVGISPDRPEFIRASLEDKKIGYKLLSDSDMDASKKFGIAYKVDEDEVNQLKEHGMDIEEHSGSEHHLLPVPAVFLVDTEGIIQFLYVNPDYKVRISNDVLLTAVKEMVDE